MGLVAGLWGFAIEPGLLEDTRLEVEVPQWPVGQKPVTVAFLTDFHVGAPHVGLDRLEKLVAHVNEGAPDMVLLGGDFLINGVLGGTYIPPEPIARRLGALRPPLGVVAVLGNHDWWNDGPGMGASLAAQGIVVLENRAIRLGPIWVAGLADDTTRKPDANAAMARVPKGTPLIGLMHDPANLRDWPGRLTIILAGHTHAGQVRLPLIGSPIIPGRAPRAHAYGLIKDYGQTLYVSAGIGTSILPVRFGAPPEVVWLTLRGTGTTP
ncbi:Phosphoesterase [Paramagnetospirillum magnetotacticum MS-1]|uniref:Phosphoesterase n=1 Tax=Paramagnetospirillum magnetotacticum MS-1 TaxID=272627 RepID=A0A0C2YT29_PARME|nr:Phosphoesterase [Paramagnetospirillum magnetotacticum MS-1]